VLLNIENLACHFPVRGLFGRRIGTVRALDGVSFGVADEEVLGIVGESGCGKSTLGKTIAGITRPVVGSVSLAGERIVAPVARHVSTARSRLQYVYQDPSASLDPRWTLRRSLLEPLTVYTAWSAAQREAKIRDIVVELGLPEALLNRYPHELSGGQQRRMGLARILVLAPQIIIMDEPTTGLDVSVQATVLELLRDLRRAFNLTYLIISHDIAVLSSMCDRIAVMYLGRIVEIGPTEQVLARPRHPYTRSLVASSPRIGGARLTDNLPRLDELPDPINVEAGCRYKTRCPISTPICATVDPGLVADNRHEVACLHWRETAGSRFESIASPNQD
jgi:oligopeptide/dipeptide ABC transporter ATP-binding protein